MTSSSCDCSRASPEMTSSNDGFGDVSDCGADPQTSPTVPGDCSGCGRPIIDRYFLQAVGKAWHVGGCLRCVSCLTSLDSQRSCFVRAGLIYCHADHHRLFGGGRTSLSVDDDITCRSPSARCAGCDQPFSGGDLVMRVHLSVFHSSCFTCCVCRRRLSRGQQFALVDAGRIYCRADYERPHAGSVLDDTESAADAGREASLSVFDGDCECEELQCDDGVRPAAKNDDDALSPSSCGVTLCRGSRRTRKVTPSSYQNTSVDNDCSETLHLSVGEEFRCNDSSTPRQKRLRTSFKHHQLRVLKTYFALNHNPDAKDLKQLSQKTGLSKRILQNARAKYRRSLQRGDQAGDEPWSSTTGAAAGPSLHRQSSSSTSSEPEMETPSCCNTDTLTSSVSSSFVSSNSS